MKNCLSTVPSQLTDFMSYIPPLHRFLTIVSVLNDMRIPLAI